jgi:DNA sulfur modification protein DndB
MSLNSHTFAAIRGRQAGDEYYAVACEMAIIPRLFVFNEETIPAELRSQRHVNKSRIPEMARYILSNPRTYIFSALTASIDGNVEFKPIKLEGKVSNLGQLVISNDARLMINDGQHRRAAIEKALAEDPNIGKETVAVVFFKDRGLKKSQQMFADLNRHAIRPSTSLAKLYDHRDQVAEVIRRLVTEANVFRGVVEMERSTLAERSSKMFPFSGIYSATKYLLADNFEKNLDKTVKDLITFWDLVGEQFDKWTAVRTGKISASEIRRDYINTHVIALQAIGLTGKALIQKFPTTWKSKIKNLNKIDWLKNNIIWQNRVIVNGRVMKSHTTIVLMANVIKAALDIKLKPDEQTLENNLKKTLKNIK